MDRNYRGIDEMPLISKEDLVARLNSHRKPEGKPFVPEMTMRDVARWCDLGSTTIERGANGTAPISDRTQIILTNFYGLLDSGRLRMEVHGKHKHFVRVQPGEKAPPAQPKDPRVEFTPMGPILRVW